MKIQTYGPKEDFDAETGEPVYVYMAEALGNDGKWHFAAAKGSVTSFVEVQENFRKMIGIVLENRMKEERLWPDGEQEAVV